MTDNPQNPLRKTLMWRDRIEQIANQPVLDTTPHGKIVYVDTNHWIGIRNAITLEARSGVHYEVYTLLQQLSKTRTISIVVSWPLLEEVRKQTEPTKSRTLELMYELCGCCMVNFVDLDILEFNSYPNDKYPTVWTVPANILGEVVVSCGPRVPTGQAAAKEAQKYLTEFQKRVTLKDFVEMFAAKHAPVKTEEQRAFIEEKNILIEQNRRNYPFRKLFLDVWRSRAEHIVRQWKERGKISEDTAIAFPRNFYWPGCFIAPWLHSYVACDISGERMKAGDDVDFIHARLALPYCDYFFTDGRLKHLVSVKPPGVRFALKDRRPMCRATIIAEPKEILGALRFLL